ncbi:lantibiotic dehydratase C-terminal domain-containing protein [Streptomyces wedmorensis]|uniref:lantibiotic dehydratase C-terminal domain-containing protein n=1 Tax=Streptomyces wedmorensis TaxID=43759 RepID=UPI00343C9572
MTSAVSTGVARVAAQPSQRPTRLTHGIDTYEREVERYGGEAGIEAAVTFATERAVFEGGCLIMITARSG